METDDTSNFQMKFLEALERQSQATEDQNRKLDRQTELLERIVEVTQLFFEKGEVTMEQTAGVSETMRISGSLEKKPTVDDSVMATILTVLENMDKKLETLEKNSNLDHDDQPFARHDLKTYEPAWRAVYETSSTKMKDTVDRWKSGMDASLIFVGLFVTIITAFLMPVLQNLAPNPSDLTNAILTNLTTVIYEIAVMNGMQAPMKLAQMETFHPSLSDEIVSLFFYSALLLSLITAIFSVFGRQWVEHLTKKPEGETYKEKLQRLNLRDELANKILKPVLDSLHPILILSITFFIVGLLFQLWTISVTVDKSITMILTSSLGSGFVLCATIATVGTVLHGGYRDESPFTMATSAIVRRCIPKRFFQEFKTQNEKEELVHLFCKSISQMDSRENYDHASTVRLFQTDWRFDYIKPKPSTVDSVVHFLQSDASQKAKLTMAWNLLDLLELEKDDYLKLGNALRSLESDTPSNQDMVRSGFFFVRMALLLRANNEEVVAYAISSFLDKETMKEVFMKVLILPEYEYEKEEAAYNLAKLAKEDPSFLDDVRNEILDLFLNDDKTDLLNNWRRSLFSVLHDDDIIELLRQISRKTENHIFYFGVLHLILCYCKIPPIFPVDFDLLNLITFLSTYEDCYTDLPGFYRSPTCAFFKFCGFMDDVLLSHQNGLSEYLEKVINVSRQDSIAHNMAFSLLDRICRSEPVESAAPLEHGPSTSASLVEE